MDILLERILSLVPSYHGGDKEFALSIGYKSGNVIADWRAGRSKSYKGKVQEISRVYGVSVDWLCGNDKKETPTASSEGLDPTTKELFEIVESASESERKMMLEMLRVLKRGGK